jgi:hypothetical protein
VNTWKVILATLVIFAAGVVTGGLLVSHADRVSQRSLASLRPRQGESPRPQTGPGAGREAIRPPGLPVAVPQFLRKEFLENLDREVNLTPDQRARIEQIIREGQERNRQLWERIAPELRKEIAEARRQIQAVLRPNQRPQFEELMKQRPQRRTEELNSPDRSRPSDQYRSLPMREGPPPEGAPQPLPPP